MAKLILGTFALLLVVSLSAWSLVNKPTPAAKETNYTWHKYNQAGDQELFPAVTFYGTDEEAEDEFECPEGLSVICARAYDGATPLDIYITKSNP